MTSPLPGVDRKTTVAGSRISRFKLCHGNQTIPVTGLQLAVNKKMLVMALGNNKFSHSNARVGLTGQDILE